MSSTEMHSLVVRIAEVISPDEADIAPAILGAALRGGREWSELLADREDSALGGFGIDVPPGLIAEILGWLSQHAAELLDYAEKGLGIVVALRKIFGRSAEAKTIPRADDLRNRLVARGLSPEHAALAVQELLAVFEQAPTATGDLLEALARSPRA